MPETDYPELNSSLNPYDVQPNYGVRYWSDTQVNPTDLTSVIENTICTWIPDIPSWSVDYSTEGPSGVTQSWLVPNSPLIALAARQMLSWNRDRFGTAAAFYDRNASLGRKRAPKNLVPVSVRLSPIANNTGGYVVNNHWTSRSVASGSVICTAGGPTVVNSALTPGLPNFCAFPTVITEKWRMDITWALDEFRNRYNVQYAKVEIEPSIRLESIQGSNMGVVPIDNETGEPDIEAVTGDDNINKINKVSTGFPVREPQLLIKITYPWVRWSGKWPSITAAGPVVKWDKNTGPTVGKTPGGCYLGCVNSKVFMGFPKGRVLYQSADMVERVSPVTGRLGYQITHAFLVLPTASWNMSRLVGDLKDLGLSENDAWPYGYMVATNKDGSVKTVGGNEVIYPYPHKDLNDLLYYNNPNGGGPLVPDDEG